MSLRANNYKDIIKMRQEGMTYKQISEIFRVSTQAVYYAIYPGKNNPSYQKYTKLYFKKMKQAAIEVLGGKCARCGFDDPRALQVDHINGDGAKKRKQGENTYNQRKYIIEHSDDAKLEYQLLCSNCNWIKRFENGETR